MSKLIITLSRDNYSIGKYPLEAPLTNENSGMSKWGFCILDGQRYFIKEFLSPVYPSENVRLDPDIRSRKQEECDLWENSKRRLYKTAASCRTGALIVPIDFFRYESRYYIVTEAVEKCGIGIEDISKTENADFNCISVMKQLAVCFAALADEGIVHSDIKPDNLLIKKTATGALAVKVIDLDAAFFADDPPEGDSLIGDPVYYAPETFLAIMEEPAELSCKADVFSLGIIFHQLLCGKLPETESEYDHIYESVLDGKSPVLDSSLSEEDRSLIASMLERDPAKRPSAKEVFKRLGGGSYSVINEAPGQIFCPVCESENRPWITRCPVCGYHLIGSPDEEPEVYPAERSQALHEQTDEDETPEEKVSLGRIRYFPVKKAVLVAANILLAVINIFLLLRR